MKNAIFTIVSNNYYSRALTLMDSLKKQAMGTDLFVCLVDKKQNEIDYRVDGFSLLNIDDIECDLLQEMKFKYNVTELNTAIKPFVFELLFAKYEKVLYLDPDIYVFNSLAEIFSELDEASVVLTPHLNCAIMEKGEDCLIETEVSSTGIFNLGFCGFKKSELSQKIIKWWCNKLESYCFMDFNRGQFYDQKWMNFLPVLANGELKILKQPGYNFAPWNFCERTIYSDEDTYFVKDVEGNISKLYFMHFSGFDPDLPDFLIQQHFNEIKISDAVLEMLKNYAEALKNSHYDEFSSIPYFYGQFENGDQITLLHRQLYRGLLDMGKSYDDPFSVKKNSFHALLKKKKLLDNRKEMLKKSQIKNLDAKMSKANKVMRACKRILGIRKYTQLLKYLQFITQFKNQLFLLGHQKGE